MISDTQITRPTALLRSSWSLFAALGLLLLGNGLLGSLVGIRAELEGFDTVLTGTILSFYFAGFVVGSQVAPVVVTRVGHVRVFAGLAALASATTLLHAVAVHPITWIIGRAVVGACLSGLYVVAESWLNASATNQTRGRLLSIYMVVVMGGIGIGQLLLNVADPAGPGLFMLAAALTSLSVLPISLSTSPTPSFDLPSSMHLKQLWRASPVGLTGGFGAGLANGAAFAMVPVFGLSTGMSVGRISILMGTMILGAVVLQWPIGAWSDRVPRRRSIVAVNAIAAIAAILVAQLDPSSVWLFVAIFLFGGSTFPVYSLSLSHVNDVLEPHQTIAASSVFILVWGVGSAIGPILAAILMNSTQPEGLFWMMGAVHLGVAAYTVYRIIVKEGVAVSDQGRYVPVPARSSGLIGVLAKGRRAKNSTDG